jgi:hypothetical protein
MLLIFIEPLLHLVLLACLVERLAAMYWSLAAVVQAEFHLVRAAARLEFFTPHLKA